MFEALEKPCRKSAIEVRYIRPTKEVFFNVVVAAWLLTDQESFRIPYVVSEGEGGSVYLLNTRRQCKMCACGSR
jgi:hypothetical protein